MSLRRRFLRRLADAEHRTAAERLEAEARAEVDVLAAENQRLRQELADAGAEPARASGRLSSEERRELRLLRRQVADLHERLHAIFTGVSP